MKRLRYLLILSLCGAIVFGLFSYFRKGSPRFQTITVVRDPSFAPFELFSKEKNMEGFTGELLRAAFHRMGISYRLIFMRLNGSLDGLEQGLYSWVVSPRTPTPARLARYLFSTPLYPLGPVLLVKIESPVRSLEDLEARLIGVSQELIYLFQRGQYPHLRFASFENDALLLDALFQGEVDGVILDSFKGHIYLQGIYAGSLKIVTGPLIERGFRLVGLKSASNAAFIEEFDREVAQMKEEGTYDALVEKWALFPVGGAL